MLPEASDELAYFKSADAFEAGELPLGAISVQAVDLIKCPATHHGTKFAPHFTIYSAARDLQLKAGGAEAYEAWLLALAAPGGAGALLRGVAVQRQLLSRKGFATLQAVRKQQQRDSEQVRAHPPVTHLSLCSAIPPLSRSASRRRSHTRRLRHATISEDRLPV